MGAAETTQSSNQRPQPMPHAPAPSSAWGRHETFGVAAVSLLFGAVFSYPMLLNLRTASVQNDWDFASELHWVAYYTVTHFHQFPIWNPYKCGGMGMLANPQSRFLTPFFLLHLLFGPMAGAHLEVTLHLALMWAGCYVLARTLGTHPLACAVGASVFCASSWFPLHLGEGHLVLLPFAYLPWFLVLLTRPQAAGKWTPALAMGLLFAIAFGEGGVLVFIYGAPLIAIFAVYLALEHRRPRPLVLLAAAAIFGAGLAMVKLIPSWELVRLHPRTPWGVAFSTWPNIVKILCARDQTHKAEVDRFFIEFGTYISPFFWVMAAAGVILFRKRVTPWIVVAALMLWLIRGDDAMIPLWTYLKDLPGYSLMRIPSRFFIPLALCIAMTAASGADEIMRRLGRGGTQAVGVLIVLGLLDSLIVGTPYLAHAFDRVEPKVAYSTEFRQSYDLDVFNMTVEAQADLGFVRCYEYTAFPTKVRPYNQPGYRGEQYMQGPGTVKLIKWTPNALIYRVDAPAASVMVVNQNYDAAWELARGGGEIFSDNGLLAIRVPRGSQTIELVCRGSAFAIGAIISLVTLLGGIALFLRERRRAFQ